MNSLVFLVLLLYFVARRTWSCSLPFWKDHSDGMLFEKVVYRIEHKAQLEEEEVYATAPTREATTTTTRRPKPPQPKLYRQLDPLWDESTWVRCKKFFSVQCDADDIQERCGVSAALQVVTTKQGGDSNDGSTIASSHSYFLPDFLTDAVDALPSRCDLALPVPECLAFRRHTTSCEARFKPHFAPL